MNFTRGGIYLAKLNPAKKDEVGKIRPVILLNAQAILDTNPPIVFVCPLSSKSQSQLSKLHICLDIRDNLKIKSYTLVEHCRSINIGRIIHPRIAQLTPTEIQNVLDKLKILIDL